MPIKNITAYRVFIGSPGGLEKERQAFRETLLLYNETDAIHAGVLFIPVGWEDTLGGVGRPQSIINEDLRTCDFAVLMFWNRWGSAPDRDGSRFTSGTEEEFQVALDCLNHPDRPMSQMVTLFKAVPARNLAEPNDQLARVLEFRKRLEREKEHLFHVFDSTRAFETLLRRHFGAWLRGIREGTGPQRLSLAPSVPALPEPRGDAPPATQAPERSTLDEARRLAKSGRRTEAEALLAQAVVRDDNPNAFIAYARFLYGDSRLEQARGYLDRALELARAQHNRTAEGNALRWIGNLLREEGDTEAAENMYHAAFQLLEKTGDQEGIGSSLNALGCVLLSRADLEGAERRFRQALAISELTGDVEGSCAYFGNLGIVLREKGDITGATAALRKAIELARRAGDDEELASAHRELGHVYAATDDFPNAERLLLRSLEVYERLAKEREISTTCNSLGLLYLKRGDTQRAEHVFRRCLEVDQRIGAVHVLATNRYNVGLALARQSDWTGAVEMFRGALAASQAAGKVADIAQYSFELGNALWNGGDIEAAREMYAAAYDQYSDLGDRSGMASAALWQANAFRQTGPAAEAERLYHEAVRLYDELGPGRGLLHALDPFAGFLEEQGRKAEAEPVLLRALELVEHDPEGDAAARLNLRLASILAARGDAETAKTLYRRSAEMDGTGGNHARADNTLLLLAGLTTPAEANEIFKSLCESGRRTRGVAVSHYGLGVGWIAGKNAVEAEQMLTRALEIAQELGDLKLMASCRWELGQVGALLSDPDRTRGEITRARDLYREAGSAEDVRRMDDELAKLAEAVRRRNPLADWKVG